MHEIIFKFDNDDEGLNLTGSVNFPNTIDVHGTSVITVKGLGEWRHIPANIVHVNEQMIENFKLKEKSKNLSKIGMNWIGIKANTDVLLSHAIRTGRTGTAKVQEQLTKFFKAIGASSIKFSILDVQKEAAQQESLSD
jgi:hypothetical protein